MAVITAHSHKYLQILVFAALAGVHARNFLYSRGRGGEGMGKVGRSERGRGES